MLLGFISAVKGLSLTNVLVMALIAVIAVPSYFVYRMLNDATVMDRFLSSYDEYTEVRSGCTVRTVRLRGGPWRWSISTGFAYQGSDRWNLSVILQNEPTDADVASYCATLGLIADKMHE